MLVDFWSALKDTLEQLYDAQDPSSLGKIEHVDTSLQGVKVPEPSSISSFNESDTLCQNNGTTFKDVLVQALDQCYDNFFDDQTSPNSALHAKPDPKDVAARRSSRLRSNGHTLTLQQKETKQGSVQGTADKTEAKLKNDPHCSYVKVPKATYDALNELVGFYKHFSEHNKNRHNVFASMDAVQRRLETLHTDLSDVHERVEGSYLTAKHGMLEAIDHQVQVVNTAKRLVKQQRNDFTNAEQRLITARDVMTDSLARRLGLTTAVLSRLTELTQGLVIKECSLSSQVCEAINNEVHELLRIVDNADEERRVQEELVSKMRGYEEERHALKEAKTVLARSGCGPKELDALLVGVEGREAELAKEMQELSDDLVGRGVHFTAQSEPTNSIQKANNETTQAHIAEIDVQDTRKLDGLSATQDATLCDSQGAGDGNELSDPLITAEPSLSLMDEEKAATTEPILDQKCATPGVQDDGNGEQVNEEGTSTLSEAHWHVEQAGYQEETPQGVSSDISPRVGGSPEQQATEEEQVCNDVVRILLDNDKLEEQDDKMTEEKEEEADRVVAHAFPEEGSPRGQEASKGKDTPENNVGVLPKNHQPEESEDSEEESSDNDDVHLATDGNTSELQQRDHDKFHRDATSVDSADEEYTKQEDGRGVQASEDSIVPFPNNATSEEQADIEKESTGNDDVYLATEDDPSEEQQDKHESSHRTITSVLSADKGYQKQEVGREEKAKEHSANLTLPNDESEEQDDTEEALPQKVDIAPDATSVILGTSYLEQGTDGNEPLVLKSEVDPSTMREMKGSTDHTRNIECNEPGAQMPLQEAIEEPLPPRAEETDQSSAEVMSESQDQKGISQPGEIDGQPSQKEEEEDQHLLPSDEVAKQVVEEVVEAVAEEVAGESPAQKDVDEPLPSQDGREQDTTDVIDQSSEQRRNSEVGESKVDSPTSTATNQLIPWKADIKQNQAPATGESSAPKPGYSQPGNNAAPALISAERSLPNALKFRHRSPSSSMRQLEANVQREWQQAVAYDKSSQPEQAMHAYRYTMSFLKILIFRKEDPKDKAQTREFHDLLSSRHRQLEFGLKSSKSTSTFIHNQAQTRNQPRTQAATSTPSANPNPNPSTTNPPQTIPQPSKLKTHLPPPKTSTPTPSPQSATRQALYSIWETIRDAPKARRPTLSPATASATSTSPSQTQPLLWLATAAPTTTTTTPQAAQPLKPTTTPAVPAPATCAKTILPTQPANSTGSTTPHKPTSDEERLENYSDWSSFALRNDYDSSDDIPDDIEIPDDMSESDNEDEYNEREYAEEDPEYDDGDEDDDGDGEYEYVEEYKYDMPDYDGEDPRSI